MVKPKVLILRTAGTNCDKETAFAFELAGGSAELVHINELISGVKKMSACHIMAIPGGFSYGDDIASGKILANELRFKLGKDVEKFIKSGKLIIGICNGFQVLVKSGLLAGATLTFNDSGRFQDEWVYLKTPNSKLQTLNCIWTQNLPDTIYLPIAHGEGKFVPKDEATLKKLWENNQVVLQYINNPNGSADDIAGICDPTGRVFGLMPHPERHVLVEQHPQRRYVGALLGDTSLRGVPTDKRAPRRSSGDGLQIFKNAVEYAKNNL